MSANWQVATLGEVVRYRKEFIEINDLESYKRCRVQLHAQGIMLRDIARGAEIKTKKQQICRAGEFLVAEIDAKVGGFGIVPPDLDGAIVSSHYFLFEIDETKLDRRFLDYGIRTHNFRDQVTAQGSTNYAAVRPNEVLGYRLPLPTLEEQRRIVERIEELVAKIEEAQGLRRESEESIKALLLSAYSDIVKDAPHLPMSDVAPLVRRPIQVDIAETYRELGIRSFGKGTFHKPAISGAELGSKRIFAIEPNDLLFNIVFAWEGAVAIAQPHDAGRVGSHRFLTCVAKEGVTTPTFLCFHFLTKQGLEQLGEASPGGVDRNRTLGLQALANIRVPIPIFEKQLWFDSIHSKFDSIKRLQAETAAELDALLPSILDKAFKGEL
jgi:type I restriction enzyme, S subunit